MFQSLQVILCLSILKKLESNSLSQKSIPTKSLLSFKRPKELLECPSSTHKYFLVTRVLFCKNINISKKLIALLFKNQRGLLSHQSMIQYLKRLRYGLAILLPNLNLLIKIKPFHQDLFSSCLPRFKCHLLARQMQRVIFGSTHIHPKTTSEHAAFSICPHISV